MRSKTQIGMVLAGWLLGTLGVAVLAYKIKPATAASSPGDEEFLIPADPVPAALEPSPLPAAEKKEDGSARPDVAAPKAEATLGTPAFPKSGTDENIVLAKAVSSGVAVPVIGGTDPKSVSPLPPIPPPDQVAGPSPVGATDKKLEDAVPPAPTGGSSALPPPPPLSSVTPEALPAPRADLLTPIPEPPPGPGQLTVAGFTPPPATSPLPPPPLTPIGSMPAAPSTFCKAPEPPAAPPACLNYVVRTDGETMREIALNLWHDSVRVSQFFDLNPTYGTEAKVPIGTRLRLPAPAENMALSRPVPAAPRKDSPAKTPFDKRALPLTGTHPCTVAAGHVTLPRQLREQLGEPDVLLATPGPDGCLWLSTPANLERTARQLERKPNGTAQARAFRRLHFAQSERLAVDRDGQVVLPEHLTQVSKLRKDGVLIGVGDHLELWDAERWQRYLEENDPTAKPEDKPRCIGVQTEAINGPF